MMLPIQRRTFLETLLSFAAVPEESVSVTAASQSRKELRKLMETDRIGGRVYKPDSVRYAIRRTDDISRRSFL